MRRRKLIYNTAASILFEITGITCGFVLPRFLLGQFGTMVNGLVSSISQFLGVISLMEFGVGAVVQSALYEPLANHNQIQINNIFVSAERFFKKIAIVFSLYTLVLAIAYPFGVRDKFHYFYTFLLIIIIAVSQFAQYYFGIACQLLLAADQRAYIQLSIQTASLIMNTVFCIVLMKLGCGIHLVKLTTSLIFLLRPMALSVYVKRHYRVNRKIVLLEEPIKQKWNGMAQHLAYFVLGGTDIMVLTVCSTLSNVSVYSVYNMALNGVKQIVSGITRGQQALLGDLYVRGENALLDKAFDAMEWLLHTIATYSFTCAAVLIVPFIKVYTMDIHDANYCFPLFAFLLTLANAVSCIRLPYNMMILAAGHYKQTQSSSIIEMLLNIILSVLCVYNFGLVGVAVGTLAAVIYRTVYLAWYLKGHILNRNVTIFIKHIAVDFLVFVLGYMGAGVIRFDVASYGSWIRLAIATALTVAFITMAVNLLFYRQKVLNAMKHICDRRTYSDLL